MRTRKEVERWIDGGWKKDKNVTWRWFRGLYRRGIDTDGFFNWQCKDLVNAYASWLGSPFKPGNAEDLWVTKQEGWTKVPRTVTPRVGDVFVMWYEYNGIEYGHTGIVRNGWTKTFRSLDQNWFHSSTTKGSPPSFVKHPRVTSKVQYGIRGYLRSKIK